MKKYKKEATTLLFITIILFLLIIMLGLSVNIGSIYLHFAKLQAICDNASHSGSTVVSDMIAKKADNYINENPEAETLNALDLLTEADIAEIAENYNEIANIVLTYIDINAQSNNINNYSYEIIYPYNYTDSDKEIFTKVILHQELNLLLGDLFEIENLKITVESINSIRIRN